MGDRCPDLVFDVLPSDLKCAATGSHLCIEREVVEAYRLSHFKDIVGEWLLKKVKNTDPQPCAGMPV